MVTEWDRVKRFVNQQDFDARVSMHRLILNWLGGLSLLLVVSSSAGWNYDLASARKTVAGLKTLN